MVLIADIGRWVTGRRSAGQTDTVDTNLTPVAEQGIIVVADDGDKQALTAVGAKVVRAGVTVVAGREMEATVDRITEVFPARVAFVALRIPGFVQDAFLWVADVECTVDTVVYGRGRR